MDKKTITITEKDFNMYAIETMKEMLEFDKKSTKKAAKEAEKTTGIKTDPSLEILMTLQTSLLVSRAISTLQKKLFSKKEEK